ncbi:MAG: phosphomannomutase/phosphoglucomutase [Betaproteobacteria bacterium]|nr:phosphomannomutase/phosphoglucomutase [Betaproteobacteria bacterium]MSQ88897.1 phosphomannomutase/phosphoglucomutase [Betaproteobacteria bacterium]
MKVPAEIFRAYDIRGIAGKVLSAAVVRAIGCALGALARERGAPTFAVGRDGRLSSPVLCAALMEGLNAAGADVIDLGIVPTPVTYFAAHHLACHSAVMVTGSHNPGEYNGLKMVIAGDTLTGEDIQGLRRRVESGISESGGGKRTQENVLDAYVERIIGDVKLARPFKVALDCGNGVAGVIAPRLFRRLGCEVTELFSTVDGAFPNHHPDPSKPENLASLIEELKTGPAELGLAFDGDGDRLGVVTKSGHIIFPDRQLMLYAKDVLARNPGAEIIYDVKCTRLLAPWIEQHGGRALVWKTGHSLVKAKLKETGAPLAGEMSGHIFFKERWYGFDDALYCGARLLEILAKENDPNQVLERLPDAPCTPELNWQLAEGEPQAIMGKLQGLKAFADASRVLTIDGVRAEYEDGFGLARASNTSPVIVLRFEGNTALALARIQEVFRKTLQPLKPEAQLPF